MAKTKINVLSDEVIGKISAGEVVERPASVVKELIENSIDAGADSIDIEIQEAGTSLIRVADNGEGMTEDDAKLSCMRHTTSKIKDAVNLYNIRTLGFRGEALASIAAVSRMDIITCTGGDDPATKLYLESGEILESMPAGRVRGMTIEVKNLFYNIPVRRKFLRKKATELAAVIDTVGRFILSFPDIDIKLSHDGKELLHATRDMGLEQRIQLILGGDVSGEMVDIALSEGDYTLSGYISRPSSTRKDKQAQMFFVNNRFVRSKALSDALSEAYRSLLERGRYPSAVLFLGLDPGEIDVNVHPTKLQVKFEDERAVKNVISEAVKVKFEQIKTKTSREKGISLPEEFREPENAARGDIAEVQTEFDYEAAGTPAPDNVPLAPEKAIFQLGNCYIVEINKNHLKVTDQHAAHERILYEFFSKAKVNHAPDVQNLLFPIQLELTASEQATMGKLLDDFRGLGFQIEPFGSRSYVVQSIPAVLKDSDVADVIRNVLLDMSQADLAKTDVID
ncbi:MAG: DNA mismatch repair endonuclease MutL, partial [Candidatus Omnitrophota bacterium]